MVEIDGVLTRFKIENNLILIRANTNDFDKEFQKDPKLLAIRLKTIEDEKVKINIRENELKKLLDGNKIN